MTVPAWIEGLPGAISVCDRNGTIIYLNTREIEVLAAEGGAALIGTNLLDCHPEPARSKLVELMENQQQNIYTIEKKGQKKLIYQTPWYENGEYAGFVEISLVIPFEMPHFIRKG